MKALLDAGKIRAIGVSNYSVEQMARFAAVAPLHTSQPPFNLFERDAEREVLPWGASHGVVGLTYGALCRGLLSGRMSRERAFLGDDLRQNDPKFQEPRFSHYLSAVERLESLARERFGKSVLDLAVRWILEQRGVGAALWGARKPSQLDAVADTMGWTIDPATLSEIDRIVAESVRIPIGPEFMAPPVASAT